jgi:hypothetical protein
MAIYRPKRTPIPNGLCKGDRVVYCEGQHNYGAGRIATIKFLQWKPLHGGTHSPWLWYAHVKWDDINREGGAWAKNFQKHEVVSTMIIEKVPECEEVIEI